MVRTFILSISVCLCVNAARAQTTDTVRFTLKEMDQRFLQKNLSLLANKANIDIAKAQTQQARLWDNPIVTSDYNLLHPSSEAYSQSFGILDPLQIQLQVQQLFKLGGKRKKQVDVNLENEKLNEFQFYDLTRNLKRQLRADYTEIVSDYRIIRIYQTQIKTITALLNGMNIQVDKGFLARKELFRIKAELVGIQHNLSDANNRILDAEGDLRVLLLEPPTTFVLPTDAEGDAAAINADAVNPADLVSVALQNRFDLIAANSQLEINKKSLILQKSLAIPDLTAGVYYQRSGAAFYNDFGFNLSIPIPLLNKNEGNIKGANFAIQQQQYVYDNTLAQVNNDVYSKFFKIKQIQSSMAANKEEEFYKSYEEFYGNLVKAYQAHTIGYLEFIDFFESYKDVKLAQLQYQQSLRQAADDLNFVVGKDVL